MTKSVLNYFALAAASSSDTRTQTFKPHDVEKEKIFFSLSLHVVSVMLSYNRVKRTHTGQTIEG